MYDFGKRIIAAAMTAALMLPLTSCGEAGTASLQGEQAVRIDAAPSDVTAAETEAAEERVKPDLPDTDWGGMTFTALGHMHPTYSQFDNFEIYAEAENGEVVNDSIYQRNRALEEKYNVKIAAVLDLDQNNLLKNATAAGDQIYDLFFSPIRETAVNITSGYLLDLNKVPYLDFSKPWWNEEVNEELSLWGRLFMTTSDFALEDKKRTYILGFNRDLAKDFGLDDVIPHVDDGTWTIDLMTDMVKTVSSDLDGDGVMTDKDRYGLTMDSYISFANFTRGCDVSIITANDDGSNEITVNNSRTAAALEKIIALTCDTNQAVFCDDQYGKVDYDHWSYAANVFTAGNGLFITAFPQSLPNWSAKCEFDYGVVPNPKMDESQEKYCSFPDSVGSTLMGIPIICQNKDFSGFMLEALSAEGKYTSLPAYIETSCKTKYTYDEASGLMLDLIFQNLSYDIGIIFDIGGLYSIFSVDIPKKKENLFASSYAKKESKAIKALDKLEGQIAEIEG